MLLYISLIYSTPRGDLRLGFKPWDAVHLRWLKENPVKKKKMELNKDLNFTWQKKKEEGGKDEEGGREGRKRGRDSSVIHLLYNIVCNYFF